MKKEKKGGREGGNEERKDKRKKPLAKQTPNSYASKPIFIPTVLTREGFYPICICDQKGIYLDGMNILK